MNPEKDLLNAIGDLTLIRGVGAAALTPATRRAVDAFAANDATVLVADVKNSLVCQAISDALKAKDGRECLLQDIAERLAGRFLVLTGVDPNDEVVLESIKIITAQAECPVLAVLEPSVDLAFAVTKLYASQLARRRKIGGAS
jgi:hypothetical protein